MVGILLEGFGKDLGSHQAPGPTGRLLLSGGCKMQSSRDLAHSVTKS